MTESKEGEIVVDSTGEHHYRKISTENSKAEADKLCETLNEQGYVSAQFPIDNGKIEVFTKFGLTEEIEFFLKEHYCNKCPPEKQKPCEEKPTCWVKTQIVDARFDEQHGWFTILRSKLAKLREGAPK